MDPNNLRWWKSPEPKKTPQPLALKKHHRRSIVLLSVASAFAVFYFYYLEPLRSMGASCRGQGFLNCTYTIFVALLLSFLLVICYWYVIHEW